MLTWVEYEKSFITSGLVFRVYDLVTLKPPNMHDAGAREWRRVGDLYVICHGRLTSWSMVRRKHYGLGWYLLDPQDTLHSCRRKSTLMTS